MTGLAPMDLNRPLAFPPAPASRQLNRLERAGWAVIAGEALGLMHGEAGMLRELVFGAGRFIGHDELVRCFNRHETRQPERPASERVATRMARLRGALEDLGLPRTAIETQIGVGYGMAPHYARRIRQIVEGS